MTTPNTQRRAPSPRDLDAKLEAQLTRQITRQFAPLDKRALGLAFGVTLALVLSGTTALALVVDAAGRFPLGLLGQYLPGYSLAWRGVPMGALWGLALGFVGGWLLALCRNTVLLLWLMKLRIRADGDSSRNVLDHI